MTMVRPRSPRFTITNAITAALTAIERARGFLEAATLSEEWVRRMSQRALLLEAHHTTHIEGTQLTLEQAERLWAGETVEEANRDDVRELLNYREAFNLVSEYLEAASRSPRADPRDPQAAGRGRARRGGGARPVPHDPELRREQPHARGSSTPRRRRRTCRR